MSANNRAAVDASGSSQDGPIKKQGMPMTVVILPDCDGQSKVEKLFPETQDRVIQSQLLSRFVDPCGRKSERFLYAYLLALHGGLTEEHCSEEEDILRQAGQN